MPALTVRNIPDETMDGLHRRAKNAHRSLNGEILLIFEDAVDGIGSSVARNQDCKSSSAPNRKKHKTFTIIFAISFRNVVSVP